VQDRHAIPTAGFPPKRSASAELYSPTQTTVGAFLGGPIGVVYFLYRNFVTLGQLAAARKCLIYGAILIPAVVASLFILPDKFPGAPFTLLYIGVARFVTQKFQLTHQQISESSDYTFKSGPNVLGMGLMCFVGSIVVILGPLYLFVALGWIR
jgi:hypothetical protein